MPPYLAINAQLFDSADHWTYRDLQKLAKRLDLSCNGSREEVVMRLRAWHREQRGTGQAGQFHTVQVRATPEGKAISPRLLSPLQPSPRRNGILTPSKGTTPRKKWNYGGENECPESPKPLGSRGNVLFSPYNMVKLIPSKEHSVRHSAILEHAQPSHHAVTALRLTLLHVLAPRVRRRCMASTASHATTMMRSDEVGSVCERRARAR